MARWQPVSRKLRAKGVRGIGVWQRQKRGAWHLHCIFDRFLDVMWLRPFMVEVGWGQQMRLDLIRPPPAAGGDYSARHCGNEIRNIVGYIARYITRDMQSEFGGQVVVRVGDVRQGNVKFAWVDGAAAAWRRGCAVLHAQGHWASVFVGRRQIGGSSVRTSSTALQWVGGLSLGTAWVHRSAIFAAGRQSFFDECCAFFDAKAALRPAGG